MSQTNTKGGEQTPIVTTFFGLIKLSPEKSREKIAKQRAQEEKKLKEAEIDRIKSQIQAFHKSKGHTDLGWLAQEFTGFQAAYAEIGKAKKDIDGQLAAARGALKVSQDAERGKVGRADLMQQVTGLAQRIGAIRLDETRKREVREKGSGLVERIRNSTSPDALSGEVKALTQEIALLEEEARRIASLDPMAAAREKRAQVQRDVNNHRDKLWNEAIEECTQALKAAGKQPPSGMAMILYKDFETKSVEYNTLIMREADAKKLEGLRTTGMAALDTVKTEVMNAFGSGGGLDALLRKTKEENDRRQSDVDRDRLEQAFNETWKTVTRALGSLRDAGSAITTEWEAKCETTYGDIVRKGVFGDEARAEAENLVSRINMAIKVATQDVATERVEFLKKLEQDAKVIKRTIAICSDPLAKKLGTEMDSEIEAIKILAGTTNAKSFAAAVSMMNKLTADWTGSGAAAAALTRFGENATQIKAITGAKANVTDFGERCTAVDEQLEALRIRATVPNMASTAAGTVMLLANAQKIQADAQALAEWRRAMPLRLRTLDEAIAEIRQSLAIDKTGFQTSFELVARDIRAAYALPGADMAALDKQLADAESAVLKIGTLRLGDREERMTAREQLNDSADKGNKQLQDEQNEATALREGLEFLGRVRTELEKQYKEVAALVKKAPTGDKQELSEIRSLLDQLKNAQKVKELPDAKRLVDSIVHRLNALESFPGGGPMRSSADLKRIQQMWTDAKGKMDEALASLATNANDVAQDLDVDLRGPLGDFGRRFNADALVSAVLDVADEDGEVKARKAAREIALRELRALRRMIDGDAMATMVGVNPFKVSKPLGPMKVFLDTVELNVLRAVPTE